MFDFYLITSVIVNILLFLIWNRNNLFDLCFKIMFLILSITGVLIVINTYHLIH